MPSTGTTDAATLAALRARADRRDGSGQALDAPRGARHIALAETRLADQSSCGWLANRVVADRFTSRARGRPSSM